MTQRQEATTDRLVNVIQSIQLGRRTGTLMARRGVGVTLEEGIVTFVNGRVTEARVGRRGGSLALNWLSTWGYCRYTFVLPTTDEILPLAPSSANISRGLKTTDSLPPLDIQRPTTVRPPIRGLLKSALPPSLNRRPLLLPPAGSAMPPDNPQEIPLQQVPPDGRKVTSPGRTTTSPLRAEAEASAALKPTDAATRQPVVPYRTQLPESALRIIERTGLSRTHRHLFLLVDGRRSTTELTRLIGKKEQELADLLDDLQRAALVRVPDA